MNVFRTRNAHRALPVALQLLRTVGERRESRNGPVLQSHHPVTTVYDQPCERVSFWAERDANPFFHFAESLWMLGGRNDVATVARFAKRMATFSDDGETFHGAYGHRWRVWMPADEGLHTRPFDQLKLIADTLREKPDDRRQVLQMWDSASDLGHQGKDVPCNLMATFQVDSDKRMNMVVFNRSNDIIWGCYGANVVHFSTLLEYVALRAGYKVGTYTQISVNWHGYLATFEPVYAAMLARANSEILREAQDMDLEPLIEEPCPYEEGRCSPYPLMHQSTDPDAWDRSLNRLLAFKGKQPTEGSWADPFFTDVAIPIFRAHDAYKEGVAEGRYTSALSQLAQCRATDWRATCEEWILRRWKKYLKEADDGPTT